MGEAWTSGCHLRRRKPAARERNSRARKLLRNNGCQTSEMNRLWRSLNKCSMPAAKNSPKRIGKHGKCIAFSLFPRAHATHTDCHPHCRHRCSASCHACQSCLTSRQHQVNSRQEAGFSGMQPHHEAHRSSVRSQQPQRSPERIGTMENSCWSDSTYSAHVLHCIHRCGDDCKARKCCLAGPQR